MTRFLPRLSHIKCIASILVFLAAACGGPSSGVARGEAIFDGCSPCHGDLGEGRPDLAAPAIAGAPAWYLQAQLDKFRSGQRGYHYMDAEGLRMRPMSRILADQDDLSSVVEYVASLPAAGPIWTGNGDVQAGAREYAVCAACHGPEGGGQEALNAPSLLHLSDWYIASSVRKYRDRVRGATPGDASGITMYPLVAALTDDQIDNVAAYIVTELGGAAVPEGVVVTTSADTAGEVVVEGPALDIDPAVLPDGVTLAMAEEGSTIFRGPGICYTCHGPDGGGSPLGPDLTDEAWLNVDGQYESIVELVMGGVAQPTQYPGAMLPRAGMPLTDEQVRAVAAYVYALSR